MKKNKLHNAENNQENEDVYTLHPANAIISDDVKGDQGISYDNDAINSGLSSAKMQLRRLVHSHSMMLSRTSETQTNRSPLLPGQMYTNK